MSLNSFLRHKKRSYRLIVYWDTVWAGNALSGSNPPRRGGRSNQRMCLQSEHQSLSLEIFHHQLIDSQKIFQPLIWSLLYGAVLPTDASDQLLRTSWQSRETRKPTCADIYVRPALERRTRAFRYDNLIIWCKKSKYWTPLSLHEVSQSSHSVLSWVSLTFYINTKSFFARFPASYTWLTEWTGILGHSTKKITEKSEN